MAETNLWEQVGNKCLECAIRILDSTTIPDSETTDTVSELVKTAISIDYLNLQWEVRNQYGVKVDRKTIAKEVMKYINDETLASGSSNLLI